MVQNAVWKGLRLNRWLRKWLYCMFWGSNSFTWISKILLDGIFWILVQVATFLLVVQ